MISFPVLCFKYVPHMSLIWWEKFYNNNKKDYLKDFNSFFFLHYDNIFIMSKSMKTNGPMKLNSCLAVSLLNYFSGGE